MKENKQILKRMAAYAYSNNNNKFESFQIGEGLIGQCVLEKQTQFYLIKYQMII